MDFFESQDAARRKTGRLVTLFAMAVVSIILSVYAVVAIAMVVSSAGAPLWDPLLFLAVVAATIAVVVCGSLYKIAQLSGGGRVVAEALGGTLVPRDTTDPDQRKILNVVEEMAIASGTPVPPVYLMAHEEGINAFAAGYTPDDAVIGVTRGSIEQLSRSELQGMIGHEFSHILNGDMRLNIRLIGLLNGILVIGMIGYFVLRSTARPGSSRGGGKDKGGAIVAILAIGAGLAIVGFMGTLFGNLIKAAVSRQREYLGDASALQFTRDPGSIAGALKRIGGMKAGSGIRSPHAAEASHMFFAKALTSGLASMFETHPPLEDRIRRIDPAWDGTYPPPRTAPPREPEEARRAPRRGADVAQILTGAAILAGTGIEGPLGGAPGGAVSHVGRPSMAHVEYAADLVRSIPAPVAEAARQPYGARAVIHALLISRDEGVRARQLARLARHAEDGVHDLVVRLIPHVQGMAPEARLPLVDLTAAALRELTPTQYAAFRADIVDLIEADRELSLFEWVLQRFIMRHLEPHFGSGRAASVKHRNLDRVTGACSLLLSILSHVGHDDPAAARAAFEKGRSRLGLPDLPHAERDRSLAGLDRALEELDTVAFTLKRDLLEAAATCVGADRRVTVVEGELLRGIADSLGCPMPPLLPGQPIA